MNSEICEEGKVICQGCRGDNFGFGKGIYSCPTCWGDGKLDWIERVTGKECPYHELSSSSSSSSRQRI